ncbi:urea carboxylase [Coraliomargarita sp. SDUM461004]|uniref:Urea carboxylase n=1 Tax=Thalassobacterium sedimentorum TaxID=3041258 RepID=A0ABU1AMX3_9BACT|nr:urea carboxylase [Coraliomargarita sp. SDUM461004]MDQ8196057.1 urea carboxylase [Coraliomargarita sp. SDUM461004]
MFQKVLIANRGEIACRIIRTLNALKVASVAIYSDADCDAPHVSMATESYRIGPPAVSESYLQADKILEIAKQSGAEAIHPGYGLLSENADFAAACEAAGLAFIGPTAASMLAFGLKHEARRLAQENAVPLLPGSPLLKSLEETKPLALEIGYPVMLKSTAGGGGIGMQICADESELVEAYDRVERLSQSHFGQGGIFLEKFVVHARHLEVQIFGDGHGHVVSLGVRDCSTQRRNQKVIEETPPANVPDSVIDGLQQAALQLAKAASYRSAGTVEFIYDNDSHQYYFLEVNTRLQVEHGVTELVTGVDLVSWMVQLAAGDMSLSEESNIVPQQGHAIQTRLYAEDPNKDFQPSSGLLTQVVFPEDVRCDHWLASGTEVSPYYDPLLAKLQVYAEDRPQAVAAIKDALDQTRLDGIETNLNYLRSVVDAEVFIKGEVVTKTLASHVYQPRSFEILRSGTMTTVQDFPGRVGYWEVGVPPSGPMDSLAFRLGNRLLGNDFDAAGLEITANGPRIQFNTTCTVVLTGAAMETQLDGESVDFYKPFEVPAGSILDIGKTTGAGVRSYLSILGGIDVPKYLGSRSTFTLGQFGGHGGRALRLGDVLYIGAEPEDASITTFADEAAIPRLSNVWDIAVLYGPHGAPEFFTPKDIETFFENEWEVHYNSARTGVRLIGPKPEWARTDGGEAGLHPSNIHDNAYAIGAIDFTGDMPVILGPDGPSLGGFVCPATIIQSERWKMGQLKPGDKVRFRCVTREEAEHLRSVHEESILTLETDFSVPDSPRIPAPQEAILHDEGEGADRIVIRQAGDAYILAEVGPMALDFKLRFHIHVLYEALKKETFEAVQDITPGIRSLQVHFDPAKVSAESVAAWIALVNAKLPPLENVTVPSRVVHLPLSWDSPSTKKAIDIYMQSVRPDAPWCPDNIEFIRRINGLDTREDVYNVVFNARYVVLGLGDVYLGAPVATPLDPRHRLVTTKYNPARTWTPENAVGIGGAYMCIYGMEGPGGYQFVGRTVQMWNRYRSTASFEPGKPWLLRFFDQIRYYPVSEDELNQMRKDFPHGRFEPKIEEGEFSLADYQAYLAENDDSIREFKTKQQAAFEDERARWKAAGLDSFVEEEVMQAEDDTAGLPAGAEPVESPVAGSVWKILLEEGATVAVGDTIAVLESMKMEIKLEAPIAGTLCAILCKEGQAVQPGQSLFGITPND